MLPCIYVKYKETKNSNTVSPYLMLSETKYLSKGLENPPRSNMGYHLELYFL